MSARARVAGLLAALLLAAAAVAANPRAAEAQTLKHNCSFCHNLHGGSYAALSDYAVVEDLCWSCHDAAVLGDTQVLRDGVAVTVPQNDFVIHDGPKHAAPTGCWSCHDHEGESTGNLDMIPLQRTTPSSGTRSVLFTQLEGANSFADGDETLDGVCEVCHTTTDYHRNEIGAASLRQHNAAADCRTCHSHQVGFQPQGGGCAACHKNPQDNGDNVPPGGRRAVLGEFGRTSHHIDWAAAGYLAVDSIPDADCEICHDQANHQQGSVRLKNADTPATIYTLTGDPNATSTEAAKLEAFCLSCHDGNGAAGDTSPFSDGITAPALSVAGWNASSHAGSTALVGCYGNGTFGCHGSGHGSEKVTLLAPHATAATGPAFAEQEEGFCFACHDADGPASTNIAAKFGGTILWVTDVVGDNSNLNLNDRHDVEQAAQARSGAVMECVSCHDPHAANSTLKVIADPDPTDGRQAGDGFIPGGTWMSEWCMECHDGSYAVSVTPPTTALFNLLQSMTDTRRGDQMGPAGSGANLKSGYGWMLDQTVPCEACHDPHASGNLFHVNDVVYSADGTTPVPPDGSPMLITDNSTASGASPGTDGYNWCNTCHTNSMSNTNCFRCHFHGTRW